MERLVLLEVGWISRRKERLVNKRLPNEHLALLEVGWRGNDCPLVVHILRRPILRGFARERVRFCARQAEGKDKPKERKSSQVLCFPMPHLAPIQVRWKGLQRPTGKERRACHVPLTLMSCGWKRWRRTEQTTTAQQRGGGGGAPLRGGGDI